MARVAVEKRARKKPGCYSWYLRYEDPITGKGKKKVTSSRTKREAFERARQLEKKLEDIEYGIVRTKRIPLSEIIEDRLQRNRLHNRSWKRDMRVARYLNKYFRDMLCDIITPDKINGYIESRLVAVQPATVNRELAFLRSVFNYALDNDKVKRVPRIKLLPEDNKRDRTLSEYEYERLLFGAADHLKPILITAWETGMRRGEILPLKWSLINLNRGIITLHSSMTKTRKSRIVPISPTLSRTLNKIPKISEYVFTYKGKRLHDIRKSFATACEIAEIEDFRFHDIRHCFIVRKRREGFNDREVMKITGHRTLKMLERYDTITENDIKKVVGAPVENPDKNKKMSHFGNIFTDRNLEDIS